MAQDTSDEAKKVLVDGPRNHHGEGRILMGPRGLDPTMIEAQEGSLEPSGVRGGAQDCAPESGHIKEAPLSQWKDLWRSAVSLAALRKDLLRVVWGPAEEK